MIRVTGVFAALVLAVYAPASRAQQSNRKTYPTPQAAAEALFQAVQARDEQGLSQILGGDEILSVDDKSEDELDRQQFVEKYREMHRIATGPDGTVLYVGAENWPFPVPLVSKNGSWSFDTKAGMQEILFRRIGANESAAIELCHELAQSSDEGAAAAAVGNPEPSDGYYFRALPAEGKPASFIAYPAEYRSSGVMTFIVDREKVYERDLGPQTAKVAKTMTSYKPDSTWQALQ